MRHKSFLAYANLHRISSIKNVFRIVKMLDNSFLLRNNAIHGQILTMIFQTIQFYFLLGIQSQTQFSFSCLLVIPLKLHIQEELTDNQLFFRMFAMFVPYAIHYQQKILFEYQQIIFPSVQN